MIRLAPNTTTTDATYTTPLTVQWTDWSDEDLLLEYRLTGIREAFEELVYRYEKELYNYLYYYLGNAADAEDVFQKTFIKVLEECNRFDADRSFRPWLYKIAANEAVNNFRRNKRHTTVSLDAKISDCDEHCFVESVAGKEPAPFEEPMEREIASKVREAVEALPDTMRQAVSLIYFQGMTYREAAAVVGVHCTAMSQRIKGAVNKLNFMLKNVG